MRRPRIAISALLSIVLSIALSTVRIFWWWVAPASWTLAVVLALSWLYLSVRFPDVPAIRFGSLRRHGREDDPRPAYRDFWEVPVTTSNGIKAEGCHGVVTFALNGVEAFRDDLVFVGLDGPTKTATISPGDRRLAILIGFRSRSDTPHPWLAGHLLDAGINPVGARFAIHQALERPLTDRPFQVILEMKATNGGPWVFDDVFPLPRLQSSSSGASQGEERVLSFECANGTECRLIVRNSGEPFTLVAVARVTAASRDIPSSAPIEFRPRKVHGLNGLSQFTVATTNRFAGSGESTGVSVKIKGEFNHDFQVLRERHVDGVIPPIWFEQEWTMLSQQGSNRRPLATVKVRCELNTTGETLTARLVEVVT